MYTIRQASARSGVPVPLLRAWERRYAVVSPARTSAGYRLYDEAAIATLIAMRRLVGEGWTASQAADEVRRRGAEAITDLGAVAETTAPQARTEDTDPGAALVEAAARFDTAAIERVLDGLFALGSYEAVIDDLVLPAVAALGAGWADGTLDIAAEHLASEAVQRRLATMFDGSSAAGTGVPVVVGLPPGDLHEIGALAFAVALRRRGLDVLYLGPDVPVPSWEHAVATVAPFAVVIGVAREADVAVAGEVATAVLAADPSVLVAAGGPAAAQVRPGLALPPRVSDAAREVAERVATGSRGPVATARGRATSRALR